MKRSPKVIIAVLLFATRQLLCNPEPLFQTQGYTNRWGIWGTIRHTNTPLHG